MKLLLILIGILALSAAYNDNVDSLVNTAKEAYNQPGVGRVAMVTAGLVVAADYDKRLEGLASGVILLLALSMLLNDSKNSQKV